MALVDLKSNLTWRGNPPAVNFIPDTDGAKGFTVNQDKLPASTKSQFNGIFSTQYVYPEGLISKFNIITQVSNPFSLLYNYAGNQSGFRTSILIPTNGYKRSTNIPRSSLENIIKNLNNFSKDTATINVLQSGKSLNSVFNAIRTARDYNVNVYNPIVHDSTSEQLVLNKRYSDQLVAGLLRANTKQDFDKTYDKLNRGINEYDDVDRTRRRDSPIRISLKSFWINRSNEREFLGRKNINYKITSSYIGFIAGFKSDISNGSEKTLKNLEETDKSLKSISENATESLLAITRTYPNGTVSYPNPFHRKKDITEENNDSTIDKRLIDTIPNSIENIKNYSTVAYTKLKEIKQNYKGDFRNALDADKVGFTGKKKDSDYYNNRNLENYYGFGELGKVGADRTNPESFIVAGDKYDGKNRKLLISTDKFRGDKVTSLDINTSTRISAKDVYPNNSKDLIKFYFEDGDQGFNVMPFRATITGLSDSFTPGWNKIDIIGRPDGAYLYTSFERSISFDFKVAALSRAEMIPMWRKLNYLATYTMPDFSNSGGKPSGPFMRLTLGDLYQSTPGFLSSLSYTFPDDATWDIADDKNIVDAKQLPTVVEVSVAYTIVGDYRPQLMGRTYSLSPGGKRSKSPGQWLADSAT